MENLSMSNMERLLQFQHAYEIAMREGYDRDDERHPSNWCRPCIDSN